MTRWLALLSLLATAAALAASPPTPEAPPFTPGPVLAWGKPLVGGPIRVTCLLQSAKEEGLELQRRFDFPGAVLVSKGGKYSVDSTASSLARRQLAEGNVDVFIVGGVYWKRLPATLRLALLEQVHKGMGLVLVECPLAMRDTTLPRVLAADPAPEAAAAVTSGVPLAELPLVTIDPERNAYCTYPDATHPAPTPEQLVTGARFGQGRICILNYSVAQSNVVYLYSLTPGVRLPNAPFVQPYPYWEYCHSLLGKAVRWAAGREPVARLQVEALPGAPVVAQVSLAGPVNQPVDLEVVVRDRYHKVWGQAKSTLTPGATRPAQWAVPWPEQELPPGGLTFVDVWARQGGEVLDWATATVDRPAAARIGAVKLDAPRYEASQPVKATLTIRGDLRGVTLRGELVGNDGRVLQRQTQPAREETTLTFSLAGAQTLVSYVETCLLAGPSRGRGSGLPTATSGSREPSHGVSAAQPSGQRTLWRERTPVFLAPGAPKQFFAYSWMDPDPYYMRDYLRRIQDQGVDGVTAGGGAATYFFQASRLAVEQNLRIVPTNVVDSRLGKAPDGDPSKLPRPFTDPKVMAEETERLHSLLPTVADSQPLGYSLMDEWALGWSDRPTDYSDASLTAFRRWIRGRYPSVEALNQEWGTTFTAWEAVTPTQAKDVQAALGGKTPDYSQLNLAAFVDYRLFMDTVGPTAFADFRQTIRAADPGARVGLCGTESNGTWYGYEWYGLSHALDFVCGYGDAAATPNISRDLRGLQRELQRSFRQPGSLLSCWVGYHESDFYRDQALKLLLHDFQGIAYFGGNPVIFADFPYLDYDFTLSRRALLAGACTSEIRRGLDQLLWNSRRDNSGLAVLLSPASQHVASGLGREAEWSKGVVGIAQALEDAGLQYDFVAPEQVAAGVLPQRGYKALLAPQVTCLGEAQRTAIASFLTGGGALLYDRLPGELDEHGRARASAPPWTGERVVALPALPDKRAEAAKLLGDALGKLGLATPVTVAYTADTYLPVERIVYRNGDHLLVSLQTDLVAEGKQPEPPATITLPRVGFVYDVRGGKALGKTRTVTAPLDPMHILLYAILPYEVRGVQVTAPAAKLGQTVPVTLQMRTSAAAGDHYLRVTVTGPDGQERPGFATTVTAKAGRTTVPLRFALNDPTGKWRVQARDAETGLTGVATLEVRP